MKMTGTTALAAAGVLALSLGAATAAQAQQDPQSTPDSGGTTSGPAVGTNVEPSTVTHKKSGHHHASKHHKTDVTTSPTADGAPGTAAKQGSESGATPPEGAPK